MSEYNGIAYDALDEARRNKEAIKNLVDYITILEKRVLNLELVMIQYAESHSVDQLTRRQTKPNKIL